MLPETKGFKKQGRNLLLVISFAVAMVLLTLFSVQARDAPAAPNSEQDSLEVVETSSQTLQATEATSVTLQMPYVLRNYPLPPSIMGVQMGHITDSGGLQQALNAQAKWVRGGTLHWSDIEPVRTYPPTYYWRNADEQDLSMPRRTAS